MSTTFLVNIRFFFKIFAEKDFHFIKIQKIQKPILFSKTKYGEYHKIKHFACHRDFFAHEIPRIKHTQNATFPGIKHFRASHWLKIGMKHFAYVLYVGFHAKRNLCDKQHVLFYGTFGKFPLEFRNCTQLSAYLIL